MQSTSAPPASVGTRRPHAPPPPQRLVATPRPLRALRAATAATPTRRAAARRPPPPARGVVAVATSADRQREENGVVAVATSADRQREENVLTTGLVAVLTEALRLLGVGRDRFDEADGEPAKPRPAPGDVDAVRVRVARDFARAYFVLGQLDDGVYDPDCRFADPTVAFRGVRLWRRNLALLTPFLIEPRIELLPPTAEDEAMAKRRWRAGLPLPQLPPLFAGGLFGGGGGGGGESSNAAASMARRVVRLGPVGPGGAEVLRARWFLETRLRLPWRPRIAVRGATDYTLADGNRVVDHVESWEISGTEALLQLFRPGGG